MIKELVKDEAILSQPCDAATAKDAQVAQDLLDTLASLDNAACLAANQIGVSKCIVAYLDENDQPHVMYNPTLKLALGAFKVTRFAKIKVAYEELAEGELQPRKQDFTDWTAQIIQHMIDHCKGKLV